MGLHGPVLAASDFSECAEEAIRQGLEIAGRLATRLVVCHVLPEAYRVRVLFPHEAGVDQLAQDELETKARAALQSRVANSTESGTPVEIGVEIDSGSPHAGILAIAGRLGAGLVVLGPGRTAQQVARAGDYPVLVARPSPANGGVIGATDFSDPSLPAIRMAADEATQRGARLRVIHCLDIDATAYLSPGMAPGMLDLAPVPQAMIEQMQAAALDRLATAMASSGSDGDVILRRRPAAMGIVEASNEVATALIVVGTRGRTGLVRLALGSVAEAVMSQAPCSVLVVPLHPAA